MPIRLTREIRFSVLPPGLLREQPRVTNSYGGWPSAVGIAPYLTLRATVRGRIDPRTGFVCNVRELDKMLRKTAIPLVGRTAAEAGEAVTGERLIAALWNELSAQWPADPDLMTLELAVTPFLRFKRQREAPDMVFVTQSFEFSASHRLFNPSFSDDQNWEVFGKCNNPGGHGHNYVVDVTVKGTPDADGRIVSIPRFEQAVAERVIDRLDHKHLNSDCPEFADLNPTVENITRVIWDLLDDQLAPARLHSVRVWETPKTHAEYFGPGTDPRNGKSEIRSTKSETNPK